MKQYFYDNPEIHHAVISDVWKDRSGRHWLGLILMTFLFHLIVGISTQFATADLHIFAPSIAVREILDRHTAENVGTMLKEVCDEWGILPTLSVTDSASAALGSSEMLADYTADLLCSTLSYFVFLLIFQAIVKESAALMTLMTLMTMSSILMRTNWSLT